MSPHILSCWNRKNI